MTCTNPVWIGDMADPADPRRITVVTNGNPFPDVSNASGVWPSVDDSKTWAPQDTGLPTLRDKAIRLRPDKSGLLVVGLNGRGDCKASVIAAQADKAAPPHLTRVARRRSRTR